MRTLHEALDQRVLLADGSLARRLRSLDLDPRRDYWGATDCVEVLNVTRATLVREGHEAFLRAGADVIRTNTLAASPLSLARHGLADEAFAINPCAAQVACEAVDAVPGRGRRRFVLGVVRDQGWEAAPVEIEQAVALQVEALLSGGVDAVALDITPGVGRAPMFLRGARKAKALLGALAPVLLLRGDGTVEFSDHAHGMADGVVRYRHGQTTGSDWLARAIGDERVNLIGGGGTPADTATIDRLLRAASDDGLRPWTAWRRPAVVDEVTPPSSSLTLDPAMMATA